MIIIGKKYQIVQDIGRFQLPYAGQIGTLIEIAGKEFLIKFSKELKKQLGEEYIKIYYFLGDFKEVE